LSNAVKFSDQGEIVVRSSTLAKTGADCTLLFSVQDSGIGISEEARPHIFQPFTQADSSVTRRFGGSGLGLSICKKLVEFMNGNIWFQSEENVGTTFYFTIHAPIAQLEHKQILHKCDKLECLVVSPSKNQQEAFKYTFHRSRLKFQNLVGFIGNQKMFDAEQLRKYEKN
jgi:hypothetical protein